MAICRGLKDLRGGSFLKSFCNTSHLYNKEDTGIEYAWEQAGVTSLIRQQNRWIEEQRRPTNRAFCLCQIPRNRVDEPFFTSAKIVRLGYF